MPHEWATLHGNLIVDNSAALMNGSGGHYQNVRWTYVHVGGSVIIDPHIGFYRNPPPNAKCRWSTNNGEKAPRHLDKDMLAMPSRELYLWTDKKLKSMADMYKRTFWQDLKSLTRPNDFYDLYEYFDGATLWYNGAYNLWNLVNMLVTEAHQRWPSVLALFKVEIEEWVHGLLYEWDGFEYNQHALMQWDNRSDPLVDVRFNEMFNVGLDEMGPQETGMLRDCLINHFYFLTGRVPYVGPTFFPHNTRPFDNVTAAPARPTTASSDTSSSKAIVIVSSDSQKRSTSKSLSPEMSGSDEENQSPQQPSPPASLASIPEEASTDVEPTRPADKDVTTKNNIAAIVIDTSATEAELAQSDSSISDRKDSNGSMDAVFLNPSPSRPEASSRQLSVRSAPDEQSESMLATTTLDSSAEPHHQQQNSLQSPNPSLKPRGKDKQGPWRLQHRSPPRNNSWPPHPPRTGATPKGNMNTATPLHMPLSLPNNLPPHPGMMSSPPSMQRHLHPSGYLPFGPPLPPAASIAHGMGPGMPFHNQLPMQYPPMGQPNFNQGVPAQSMGFPGGNPPLHHPVAPQDYQAKQTNQGAIPGDQNPNRRNSNVSNGSRKIRDDPVHGAVYSLREPGPRKKANSSSGRRPSFISVNAQCNNAELQTWEFNQLFNQTFRECACPKCDEATRSVYVKHLNPSVKILQVREQLFNYFGYLKPLAIVQKKAGKGALVVLRHESDAIRAVNDFENNPDKSIQGLAHYAEVWYPMFSKHYSLRQSHSTRGPMPFVEDPSNPESTPRRYSQLQEPLRGPWRNAPPMHTPEQSMIPQQFPVAATMPMVPLPLMKPQRKLWEPPVNPRKGSLEPTFPPRTEKRRPQSKSNSPQKAETRAEELLTKEDWRSKPPSEEAIDDDGEDEAVAADTVSTHSSLGSRNIVVCLPSPQKINKRIDSEHEIGEKAPNQVAATSEARPEIQVDLGIASSRTMSPELCDTAPPATAPATDEHAAVKAIEGEKPANDKQVTMEIPSISTENTGRVRTFSKASGQSYQRKNKNKRAPDDDKPTPNVHAPIDDRATEAPGRGYRKTTSDLSSAVTAVWLPTMSETVVRHKKPRAPIPSDWLTEASKDDPEPSASRPRAAFEQSASDRLLELTELIREKEVHESTLKMMDAAFRQAAMPDGDEGSKSVEEAQPPPKKKPKFKKGRKAQSAEAQKPRPLSPSSSHHTVETASSRGPSPAMQSHDDSAALPNSKPKPIHKHNSKRYKKMRRMARVPSDFSEGPAKSSGPQDTQSQGASSGGSPMKELEPQQHTMPSRTRDSEGTAEGKIAEDDSASRPSRETYRAHNGGSLRMKKNRSPEKAMTTDAPQERDSPSKRGASTMPTIFEPPNASTVRDQETSVKDSKKLEATPKAESDTNVGSELTPRSWSSVFKNEDPFTASESVVPTPKAWIKDSKARSPQKSTQESSPTPSPGKKAGHKHTKSKTKLSATAPLFVSSRPTSPVLAKVKLNASVQPLTTTSLPPSPARSGIADNGNAESSTSTEKTAVNELTVVAQSIASEHILHHAKKPSLPGQSTGLDKRFITPADQIADPRKLAQPGAPAREKKTTGSGQGMDSNSKGNKKKTETGKKAKASGVAVAESAPSMSNDNFPTLDEAAAVDSAGKKKRAASIAKKATPSTTTSSASASTAAHPPPGASPATTTSPDERTLTPSGQVGAAKPAKPTETMHKSKNNDDRHQSDSEEAGEWRVVSSSKKGSSNGRGGRGGSLRGGRFMRGFSGPSDERKGG